MAVITGGINDGFIGKAGTVVGYYRLGKWIIRALPKKAQRIRKELMHKRQLTQYSSNRKIS